ncbi:MAG: beta-glucosidase [Candidatus Eisenbacteria bacterium]|uniref:Beta-glucosidase n=1 Tax=Eiseniibacteriota bacterium TaxID=2212470 RepID=A0A849SNG5_UNCEI|nr:beta-glucosidase [Candidatus Eisenbacteria bacterium]
MSTSDDVRFPDGFLWGAATSAYQIEGSPLADGAGPSIWHRFAHTPGRVLNGDTGDIACDHYRRWPADIELMKSLGLTSYRLSISWSRVMPDGRGVLNPAGVAFYDRLIDALLAAGIRPMVTLYHWDLPAALDDQGGWLNRDIVGWFADYATAMYGAFDDRVALWCTLNEPWVVVDAGYLFGVNAPGHANVYEAPIASHHLLLAHAEAVRAYRAVGRHQVGLVVNLEPKDAASDSAADRAAVVRADAYMNRQYLDPVFLGRYPSEMGEIFGDAWPRHDTADLARIQEPFDFLGVNYYTRKVTRHDPARAPVFESGVPVAEELRMTTGWEVHPPSFGRILRWVRERYGAIPIYVTENGGAFADPARATDGRIEDPRRVDYYRSHLAQVRQVIREGVDVRGYYAWSLLDNFEWASGYSIRMGLAHVDYETQQRTVKASGEFYREVIRTRGAALEDRTPLTPTQR